MHSNRRRHLQRGQVAIFVTMSLVVMMGLLGFVVDFGWSYFRKQAAMAAAQSAAAAAIVPVAAISPVSCFTAGIQCQNPTACPASPPSPPVTNLDRACLYAKQNGFVTGDRQTVMVEAHDSGSPVPGVIPTYWVRATISERLPQLFSAVLGHSWATVSARSSAGVFANPANSCIFSLKPTDVGFKANGNTTVTSGCGIWVDSNDPYSAMVGGGSANVIVTPPPDNPAGINVVGNYSPNGGVYVSPNPTTGVPVFPDPLANVPPPAYDSSHCDSTGITESSHITMTGGVYVVCGGGFTMNSNKTLTLPAGTYVFNGGSIDLKNGTLRATGGVTFYFTNNVSAVSINGNMDINLSAPTTGAMRGMLFYQDRNYTIPNVTLNGGSNMILNGALYFKTSDVSYSGGNATTNSYTALVASTLTFIGNTYFAADVGGTHTRIGMPSTAIFE